MRKAELQWNTVLNQDNSALDTQSLNIQSLNIQLTLEHLIEVINEMQEEICDRVKYKEIN